MTFHLEYEIDFHRLISAVVNDSRSVIPSLVGQDGNAVYAYAQSLIAQVVPGVLVYRIVTESGNLGGIVGIETTTPPVVPVFQQLRPAFIPFSSEISQVINNFIVNRIYLQDVLY